VSRVPAREFATGSWAIPCSALRSAGSRLSPGVYFLRMRGPGRVLALKRFALLE